MKILSCALLLLTSYAFADDAKFAEHKAHMIKEMDDQIAQFTTAKGCISSATDHAAMKACHEALHKAKQKHHAAAIDEKIKHLQEEKEKLNKKD